MEKKNCCLTGDVVLVGDILVDNICWVNSLPKSGSDIAILKSTQQSGGSAANTCCVLSDLGGKCSFCGIIGSDSIGKELTGRLRDKNIDISCLQVSESRTGYTFTMVEPDGERTMLSYRDASSCGMKITEELLDAVSNAKILYISGYLLSVREQAEFVFALADTARSSNTVVMLDTSPIIGTIAKDILDRMLSLTDILMPNRRELFDISCVEDLDRSIEILLEKVPALVIKMGSDGSCLVVRAGCTIPGIESETGFKCIVPAETVKAVDTTGAGDSFNAGFIASYLENTSPEECLHRGNYIASQVISGKMPRSIML